MTLAVMLAVLVLSAVLQAVLPPLAALGQAKLPLLLGPVIYYALTSDRPRLVQAAVLAGLLQDALSLLPLGYSALAFCLVAVTVNRFRDTVFVHAAFTHMIFGALAAAAVTLMLSAMMAATGIARPPVVWLLLKLTGSLLLGAVAVPLMFQVTARLDRMVGNVREGT